MKCSFTLIALAVVAIFVIGGCVPAPYRTHAEMSGRTDAIKTLVLLEPDIKISEVSAGGVREEMHEWSRLGAENVTQSIINRFRGMPVAVKVLKKDGYGTNAEEIKDILALYEAVSWSIYLHTYNEYSLFPDKKARFDYTVGSVEALLQKLDCEALLVVHGEDEIATSGKKAVNVLKVLTGAPVRLEGTYMRAALVGKNGDILWFNVNGRGAGSDLRDRESADRFVSTTFAGFPGFGK